MKHIDPAKTIHIAIDVQKYFCGKLHDNRRHSFPVQVRNVADVLLTQGVSTLWVAYNSLTLDPLSRPIDIAEHVPSIKSKTYYANNHIGVSPLLDRLFFRKYLNFLLLPTIHKHETIFVKANANGFRENIHNYWFNKKMAATSSNVGESGLAHWLTNQNYECLMISGINTSQCVASTINGAIETGNGYRIIALIDMMADSSNEHHEGINGGSPYWHSFVLKEELADNAQKIQCETISTVFETLRHGRKQASPLTRTQNLSVRPRIKDVSLAF